jgi:hypothetical protein
VAVTKKQEIKKQDTDPVQDDNLDKNDIAKGAADKGAKPVTGDAAADANPEAVGGKVNVAKEAKAGTKAADAKTPAEKDLDSDTLPPLQEPSGALDSAVRERENTAVKDAMPPDHTPDKVEQKINEEVGAMTTGIPDVAPEPQPDVAEAADDGKFVFTRRLHDLASGGNVDRFRAEVVAAVRERGHTIQRLKETIDPPLNEANDGGMRDWTIEVVVGK